MGLLAFAEALLEFELLCEICRRLNASRSTIAFTLEREIGGRGVPFIEMLTP